jgi:transcriptional regulator EpsA
MASSDTILPPELLVRIMRNSLSIQSHFQLLVWMQGDFQEAIPHDVMISFSGSLGGETYHYDIVSSTPGIRTEQIPASAINEFRSGIHQHWSDGDGRVTAAFMKDGLANNYNIYSIHDELHDMKHILFHAIPDTRFKADHLYILLRRSGHFSDTERRNFELLLPHVDSAVRKIDGLPVMEPEQVAAPILLNSLIKSGLTTREIEILEWVRNGKTNIEIGMILDISSFTVKNHLQRIYRKINVSNRAQAVGKLEEIANGSIAYIADQYMEQLAS